MKQENIWTLIARKLSGEATKNEMEALQELLEQNPEVHYSLMVFEELWKEGPHWYRSEGRIAAWN